MQNDALNHANGGNGDAWVDLTGCTFTNCQSKDYGGGFRSTASYTKVKDCTFTSCSARNGAGAGGAIGISSTGAKKAEIYACQLTGCEATKQGGGIYYSGTELILGDTYVDDQNVSHTGTMSITNCTAANEGGGIYHNKDGGTFSMTNAAITGNTTKNSPGGGVCHRCEHLRQQHQRQI